MGKRKISAMIFGLTMSAVLISQTVYADKTNETEQEDSTGLTWKEGLYESEDEQQVYVLAVSEESAFVVRKGYGEEGWYTLCDVLTFDKEDPNRAVSAKYDLFPDYIWKEDCLELRTEGGSFADGEYIRKELPKLEEQLISDWNLSDEDLAELALWYYEAQYDYKPGSAGVQDNGDGTVSIQLYDNLDDHNSTCAWYTIDRLTLQGTDDNTGETIDLLQ